MPGVAMPLALHRINTPRAWLMATLACALLVPAGAEAADLRLRALLNSGNGVSATQLPATGEARAVLADDNGLRIDLVYSELEETATGAELRVGKANGNGAVIRKFELDIEQSEGRVVGALFDVSPEVAVRIQAGEAYLVITTVEHPHGVIRGQLLPHPPRVPESPLADD